MNSRILTARERAILKKYLKMGRSTVASKLLLGGFKIDKETLRTDYELLLKASEVDVADLPRGSIFRRPQS